MKTPEEVIHSLSRQFSLDLDSKTLAESEQKDTLTEITEVLSQRILELLRHDHTTLFNILYRIDIQEELVKEALSASHLQAAAYRLAELIVERQMQKYINKKAWKL